MSAATPLLELRSVSKRFEKQPDLAARMARWFGARGSVQTVHAVSDVSLAVYPGEVVALVGESGCGKSTLGRLALGLLSPSAGVRLWQGEDMQAMRARLSQAAWRREMLGMQMIFQDPYASLNPRMRVERIIGEAPVVHGLVEPQQVREHVAQLMQRVGLDPQYARRFAHQFSGGQRARIGIARALAVNPRLLICDEAVAALDVSIQAQVLNLFMALREEFGLTYLFITHDLGVVRHISDRVVVMYLGRVVETGTVQEIFSGPLHPYTRALVEQAPRLEVRRHDFAPIRGEMPSPLAPPSGCHFHPRCPHATARCADEAPELRTDTAGRSVACHLHRVPAASAHAMQRDLCATRAA